MSAIENLMNSLLSVFAPMDARVLEQTQEWAKGRVEALREFKSSDEYRAICRNAYVVYPKLFEIAGGKSWYNLFSGRSSADIVALVEKHCRSVSVKRNASIAAKLSKAGVTEVVSEEFTYTHDGFNGVFVVNTDAGRKSVSVDTVYAGGYNVQCLHLRVLVKVR